MKKILLATVAIVGFSGVAMAGSNIHTITCTGEFQEGEGLAGIKIGPSCYIKAGSEEQIIVDEVCDEGSICEIVGEGKKYSDGDIEIKRVHTVKKLKNGPKEPSCFETGKCFGSY